MTREDDVLLDLAPTAVGVPTGAPDQLGTLGVVRSSALAGLRQLLDALPPDRRAAVLDALADLAAADAPTSAAVR